MIKKIITLLSVGVLIAFSILLTSKSSASSAVCHANNTIQGNDIVLLQDDGDWYLGKALRNGNYSYATMRPNQSDAGRHKVGEFRGNLEENKSFQLIIVDKDDWEVDFIDNDRLGAFLSNKNVLYYKDKAQGDKVSWHIKRPNNSSETGAIKYGEKLYIVNDYYNKILINNESYVSISEFPTVWTILEYCP